MSVISQDVRSGSKPDRNLALELVRVTEAAALAAARWVGRGDKEAADQAAVDAMRLMLHTVPMDGVVVIGEGEKDEAPMLYNGERIGDGSPPVVDIAVDPLEGTRLTALGEPSALAVVALSERGTMFDPGPCVYMEKIAGAPRIADCLSLTEPLGDVIRAVAERKGGRSGRSPWSCSIAPATSRRSRSSARSAGGSGSSRTATSPRRCSRSAREPASTCSGGSAARRRGCSPPRRSSHSAGQILGRLWPRDDEERQTAVDAGYDLERVLDVDTLVGGYDVFFAATGVTDGDLLDGVRYLGDGHASTESLVMRSRSGTVRKVGARHDQAKLREVTTGLYG